MDMPAYKDGTFKDHGSQKAGKSADPIMLGGKEMLAEWDLDPGVSLSSPPEFSDEPLFVLQST